MKKLVLPLLIVMILAEAVYLGHFLISQVNNQSLSANDVINPLSIGGSSQSAVSGTSSSSQGDIKLTIASPTDGTVVFDPQVTIKGKTTPGAEVYANDVKVIADNNGNFSAQISLTDLGDNPVVMFAVDQNGNYIEENITLTYEFAPTV